MCHHWEYDGAYERSEEPEREIAPEDELFDVTVAGDAGEESADREDDPLADVPTADD